MSLSGKTVLVTGATGFLGGALARRLATEGVHVRALARRPDRDRFIRDVPGIELVMGDLTDADRMHEVVQGCTVVFHVAAALGGSLQTQREINVIGTRNMAQASARAKVGRFVHVSTISVYGYRNQTDVTENTPLNPAYDPYSITKCEAERALCEVAKAQELPFSICRPGMIYGPRSKTWTRKLFTIARRKPTIWFGDGHGAAYPIYVDDVVDLLILLATHPAAVGEVFNCTPDPSPTWREFLEAYSRLAGHSRWLGTPPLFARPVATVMALVAPRYSQRHDLPDLLSFIQRYITYKTTQAHDLLGWQPKVSLEAGVASCESWLREKGLLK